jgi:hypothetical protein
MPVWVIYQSHTENKYQNCRGNDILKEGSTNLWFWNLQISVLDIKVKAKINTMSAALTM